jgi:DNA-binding NarL/FixJ family response regulator
MGALCLFLVDDHALFRSGLRLVLESGLDQPVVHEMASVEEALASPVQPHLVLLDVWLGGIDGISGLAALKARWPRAGMIVVASDAAQDTSRKALAHGAQAFVSKAETPQQMLGKVRKVLEDMGLDTDALPHSGAQAEPDSAQTGLSERQMQVLGMLAEGLTNRMIAQRLFLSEHTVRWHVQAIFAALEASSRSEAVFLARRKGWIA